MAYVYILKSLKDLKRYIGSTPDLKRRLNQHDRGLVLSTRSRLPLVLFAYQRFDTIQEAAFWEKKYKKSHDLLEREIKSGAVVLVNGE